MMDLNHVRRKMTPLQASFDLARKQVKSEKEHLRLARERLANAEEAQAIVQGVAQDVQQRVHSRIALLVTRCLKAVFGPDAYEFKINFERKRGRTEARLLLVRGDLEVDPPEASGGGVVDVVSLGLRIACLTLHTPARRKLLCLDEPLRHLSRNYRPAARDLIEAMAEELGIQFVLVTHDSEFELGHVVELG